MNKGKKVYFGKFLRFKKGLISKDEFKASKSEKFVEDTYNGSLPAFIAAFMSHKKISNGEIEEIQKMINDYREG